jgi:hypothetical protein
MPAMTASRGSENGNIFFYIFLGIVLFAALGYAVSRSSISAKSVSEEKARLYASELVDFAQKMQTATTRLRLRGCAENQLDFSNDVYKNGYNGNVIVTNTQSPVDDSCDLFAARGGVVPYVAPADATGAKDANSSLPLAGHGRLFVSQIANIGTDGASGTASANELFFRISWLNEAVCRQINRLLGVENPSGRPPADMSTSSYGLYTNGSFAGSGIMNGAQVAGRKAYCVGSTANSWYFFDFVLLAR